MPQRLLYNLATDKARGLGARAAKFFLFLLSWPYGLFIRIMRYCRQASSRRLPCAIISIGNITVGGTGKTPLVEYTAQILLREHKKVAVVMRGYKKTRALEAMGDEAYLLKKNLGGAHVIVDADRVRAARKAKQDYGVDAIILDDGFQQWGLKKDLEIVAIDASNPFGNKHMLPRGLLREPLSSLKRADVFALTKTDLGVSGSVRDSLGSLNPRALVIETRHKPHYFYRLDGGGGQQGTGSLSGKTAASVCGIGDPAYFEKMLADLKIQIASSFRFPDHHAYTVSDIKKIIEEARSKNLDCLITTEKDAVKIKQIPEALSNTAFFVLRIGIEIIKNEQAFLDRLHKLGSV